ncbi:MAG: YARHG domain-containing protein [Clostridia bacterium]|nr:YARHG domain-containing protein [Clostridia bacterium]
MKRITIFLCIAACALLLCACASAETFTLDRAEKTADGYRIDATVYGEFAGQGGTFNTFVLSHRGQTLASRQDLFNGYWDREMWSTKEADTATHRIRFAYVQGSGNIRCWTTARFTLPLNTPAGTYRIDVTASTPSFWGGDPDRHYAVTFTVGEDGSITKGSVTAGGASGGKVQRRTTSVQFLIDSDTRQLTEQELWDWDRESLHFMFNEIFARHGFTFDEGGVFYNHFNSLAWYQSTPKTDDQTAYHMTTDLEWRNYNTIKKVLADMNAKGHPYTKQPGANLLSWRDIHWSYTAETLTGFVYVNVPAGQRLEVYSAPSASSWRGANGKAMVNTDGYLYAAGWDNGWLLIFYDLTGGVNAGGIRVGYVDGSRIRGAGLNTQLRFSRESAAVTADCTVTDDPLRCGAVITALRAGDTVTYLTTMVNQNGQSWDYIETTLGGKLLRGFVPAGSLDLPETAP